MRPNAVLTTAEHEARLEAGWRWLGKHPNRRDWEERFEIWRGWLARYEEHCREVQRACQAPAQEALVL